jgi:TonB family protein
MKTLSIFAVIIVLGFTSFHSSAQQKVKAGYGVSVTQVEPQFYVGEEALEAYLVKAAHYPDELTGNEKKVKVYVGFVVDKTGKVKDATVTKSSGNKDIDAEAVRIIQQMPVWIPGSAGSEKVDRQVILAVNLFEMMK